MSAGLLPLVSVITPAYNAAPLLEQTLLSVQRQDYPCVEHIVINDGSTDNDATAELLRCHANVRSWCRPNRGQYPTINEGVAAARGELLLVLSADDLLLPGAVRAAVNHYLRRGAPDVVYGRWRLIDSRSRPLPAQYQITGAHPLRLFRYLLHISHCALFARRDSILQHNLLFSEKLRYCGDADWIQRMIDRRLRFSFIDRPLAAYRIHEQQTSRPENLPRIHAEHNQFYHAYHTNMPVMRAVRNGIKWRNRTLIARAAWRSEGPEGFLTAVREWRQRQR